jgi:predicted phosphodiesterase
MRIAILSDIHGNSIALDAVLEDIQAQGGADAYWVLGDLAAMGPDPVGVLERVNDLPNALFVRGNTDRYICNSISATDAAEGVKANPDSAAIVLAVNSSIAWAQGALTASGWVNWLASIGLDARANLPDGTRVLLVHAAPGTDDGAGVHPGVSDDELSALMAECEAELVMVGHTHWPQDRNVGKTRVINPGSISVPWPPDLSASYGMLTCDDATHSYENRRVMYDIASVIAQFEGLKHPGRNMLSARMRGEIKPSWAA